MLTAEISYDNPPDNRISSGHPSGMVSLKCESGLFVNCQDDLMEKISDISNLRAALKKMRARSSPGIDGMTVKELKSWTNKELQELREKLLKGTFKPSVGKRTKIPKSNGEREICTPTAIDRLVQKAIATQINRIVDPIFSERSYGYRPGLSQTKAVDKTSELIQNGYRYLTELDIEKFFDNINQDKIISKLSRYIKDRRVITLVRQFMIINSQPDSNGKRTGVIQGGPLSPILSNLLLDDLDKELEKRNVEFVRYADDLIIFTRTKKAAKRVSESTTRFIENNLGLKINKEKTRIINPGQTSFLGYKFTRNGKPGISNTSLAKLREKIDKRQLKGTQEKVETKIRGWTNYFGKASNRNKMKKCHKAIGKVLRHITPDLNNAKTKN